MAHFAEIDNNKTVTRVVVISNEDLKDKNGIEQEALGVEVCRNIFGPSTNWVQTSYNNKFRKQYAGIGFTYNTSADVFVAPQPFPWFTLNETFDWICPDGINPVSGEPFTEEELQLIALEESLDGITLPDEI